eukprot:5793786-Prymnesium_polylepis.1
MAAAPASAPPTSSSATSEPTHFVVMVTGQIEAGRYEGLDSLYCRYAFTFGDDWKVVSGVEEGITQLSTASGGGGEQGLLAVWNFPVDVTFRATSAHGWPQIVISVYGNDSFGRSDVIIGYGAIHLPIGPGRHELYIRTFRPLASSLWCARRRAALVHVPLSRRFRAHKPALASPPAFSGVLSRVMAASPRAARIPFRSRARSPLFTPRRSAAARSQAALPVMGQRHATRVYRLALPLQGGGARRDARAVLRR